MTTKFERPSSRHINLSAPFEAVARGASIVLACVARGDQNAAYTTGMTLADGIGDFRRRLRDAEKPVQRYCPTQNEKPATDVPFTHCSGMRFGVFFKPMRQVSTIAPSFVSWYSYH